MTDPTPLTYFAYGSNMLSQRLRARVASAQPAGVGRLHGHQLRWHMHGSDGSAKCDALHTGHQPDCLWGVLYTIDPREKRHLDRAEGLGVAYAQALVRIVTADAEVEAFTYRALRIRDGQRPFHWYRQFVLRGAREHGLPAEYLERLAAVEALADPDPQRAALNEAIYVTATGTAMR